MTRIPARACALIAASLALLAAAPAYAATTPAHTTRSAPAAIADGSPQASITRHQTAHIGFEAGLNEFSDWTDEEMAGILRSPAMA